MQEAPEAPPQAEQLLQLEQRLSTLWERVEAGGHQAEQRHQEVVHMYQDLKQQSPPEAEPELGISSLLDQRLDLIKAQLEEERLHRKQWEQQQEAQRRQQAARLEDLELRMKKVSARAEVSTHTQATRGQC